MTLDDLDDLVRAYQWEPVLSVSSFWGMLNYPGCGSGFTKVLALATGE